VFRQISALGDFRSGAISGIRGGSGKRNCHCHGGNHPVHDLNFRLTRKRKEQSMLETFPIPGAVKRARREVVEFHHFQMLVRELLNIDEDIFRLRTVAGQPTTAQEAAEAIQCKVAREVDAIAQLVFADECKAAQCDL
jgi:hypothetical protein